VLVVNVAANKFGDVTTEIPTVKTDVKTIDLKLLNFIIIFPPCASQVS